MDKNTIFSLNVIIALIVGVALGFGGGTWFSVVRAPVDINDALGDADTTEEVAGVADAVFSGKNAILVRDQKAGINVEVELVTLENVGWVVIHEDNEGALGNALGAQLFDFGSSKGVVELLRGTEAGRTYYATIRQDDGDRAFDLTKDLLLSDEAGNPVQVKFKATDGSSPTEDSEE